MLNLPWEEINETNCKILGTLQTVFAADIVYDQNLFKHLIFAIKNLSEFCDVENFIFSCTERNSSTLNSFQAKMGMLLTYLEIKFNPISFVLYF